MRVVAFAANRNSNKDVETLLVKDKEKWKRRERWPKPGSAVFAEGDKLMERVRSKVTR